jgi:Na+/proline symporter
VKERLPAPAAIRFALAMIITHAAVGFLHSAAHLILGVQASQAQLFFIVIIIMLAPPVAGLLLWKGMRTTGALLLACSMAGSLIFGVYNHFMALSPDHVSNVGALPQKFWAFIFQITAALLAFVEAVGIWAGIRLLKKA